MTYELVQRGPGPHVLSGRLYYVLLDGSMLRCNCIADPWASQIVEASHSQSTLRSEHVLMKTALKSIIRITEREDLLPSDLQKVHQIDLIVRSVLKTLVYDEENP